MPLEVEMRTPQVLRKGSNRARLRNGTGKIRRRTERFDAGTTFIGELTH
jgi:hypothetical protein